MILLIILIVIYIIIYIISVIGAYKFIQKAYSKYPIDGRWSNTSPTSGDIFMVFIPILNSIIAIDYLLGNWKRDRNSIERNKFFNIKK